MRQLGLNLLLLSMLTQACFSLPSFVEKFRTSEDATEFVAQNLAGAQCVFGEPVVGFCSRIKRIFSGEESFINALCSLVDTCYVVGDSAEFYKSQVRLYKTSASSAAVKERYDETAKVVAMSLFNFIKLATLFAENKVSVPDLSSIPNLPATPEARLRTLSLLMERALSSKFNMTSKSIVTFGEIIPDVQQLAKTLPNDFVALEKKLAVSSRHLLSKLSKQLLFLTVETSFALDPSFAGNVQKLKNKSVADIEKELRRVLYVELNTDVSTDMVFKDVDSATAVALFSADEQGAFKSILNLWKQTSSIPLKDGLGNCLATNKVLFETLNLLLIEQLFMRTSFKHIQHRAMFYNKNFMRQLLQGQGQDKAQGQGQGITSRPQQQVLRYRAGVPAVPAPAGRAIFTAAPGTASAPVRTPVGTVPADTTAAPVTAGVTPTPGTAQKTWSAHRQELQASINKKLETWNSFYAEEINKDALLSVITNCKESLSLLQTKYAALNNGVDLLREKDAELSDIESLLDNPVRLMSLVDDCFRGVEEAAAASAAATP
jgi:hypothetical protein